MPARTAPRPKTGTDAIAVLKTDHQEVKELFKQVEGLGERANLQRGRLGGRICAALELHSQIEKNIFYPAFKERAENHEERSELLEAYEEHGIVDRLVAELKKMDPKDERYEAKLKVLIESVTHHVKEEESEMFPTAREMFDKEELSELGTRLLEAKGEL